MLPVAREFQTLVIIFTLVSIGLSGVEIFDHVWIWSLWIIVIFFVRDFRRRTPADPLANISPVDGRIVNIENDFDPHLQRQSIIYTIRQSMIGEFNLHSPAEGKLRELWVKKPQHGKTLSFWIETDGQDQIVLEINLQSVIQHVSTHTHPGERIGQGERLGFTAIACLIRVYLPVSVKRVGCVGDKVIAGQDTLANFTH